MKKRILKSLLLGTLSISLYCAPSAKATAQYDGVFIGYGQSNCVGEGNTLDTNSGSSDAIFGNDYQIHVPIADPTDSASNQVDTISIDLEANGSVWPICFSNLDSRVPGFKFMYVPCPLGGQSISNLVPAGPTAFDHTNRSTLYGSMKWRALQASTNGPLVCMLYWQFETDALNGMNGTTWRNFAIELETNVWNDLHIPIMICQGQVCRGVTAANQATISNAIVSLQSEPHIIAAQPDLSKYTSDDNFHLIAESKKYPAGVDWGNAIYTNFYAPPVLLDWFSNETNYLNPLFSFVGMLSVPEARRFRN